MSFLLGKKKNEVSPAPAATVEPVLSNTASSWIFCGGDAMWRNFSNVHATKLESVFNTPEGNSKTTTLGINGATWIVDFSNMTMRQMCEDGYGTLNTLPTAIKRVE